MDKMNKIVDFKTILKQRVDEWNNGIMQRDNDGAESQFGWVKLADSFLPYIIRIVDGAPLRYVSIKHTEMFLLAKYFSSIHPDIISKCSFVEGFHISTTEALLLTSINYKHIREEPCLFVFIAGKDYIARLDDIVQYYLFLSVCDRQLQCKKKPYDMKQCGYVRYCTSDFNVVPYIIRDKTTYLPLFFFSDGIMEKNIDCKIVLKDQEWAYIKFCCILMGLAKHIQDFDSINLYLAIPLDYVKKHSAPITYFEHSFWPNEISYSSELFSKTTPLINTWIKVPLETFNAISPTSDTERSSSMALTNDTDQNNESDNQIDKRNGSNASDFDAHTTYFVSEENTPVIDNDTLIIDQPTKSPDHGQHRSEVSSSCDDDQMTK